MREKRFEIYGWRGDGSPLVRTGTGWLEFTHKRTAIQINRMTEGQLTDVDFLTAAGWIKYTVRRTQ